MPPCVHTHVVEREKSRPDVYNVDGKENIASGRDVLPLVGEVLLGYHKHHAKSTLEQVL